MPEYPLLPGVLMLETAAQLCCFYNGVVLDRLPGFFGFGGVDRARFRGTVLPGQRLIVLGKAKVSTPNRSVFETQGLVDGKIVFEATIMGLRIPPPQIEPQ
jgi:3-hydroxyacyl-[acyl-carrier-protein] dehydratase